MRSSPNSNTWGSRVVMVGLAVICFSGQLSGSGLVSAIKQNAAPTDRIRRMAAISSGLFINEEQVQKEIDNGQTHRDRLIFLIQPVQMSLFGEDNETFYVENSSNGHLTRRQIFVLGEDNEGLIRVRTFNLKIPLPGRPWSVDISSLEDLTTDDLEYMEGCDLTFYEIKEKLFLGKFPECILYPPESNRYYPTCDGFFVLSDQQSGSEVPTIMKPVYGSNCRLTPMKGQERKNCVREHMTSD